MNFSCHRCLFVITITCIVITINCNYKHLKAWRKREHRLIRKTFHKLVFHYVFFLKPQKNYLISRIGYFPN